MSLDRILGILGFLMSVYGIIQSSGEFDSSWVVLGIGIILITYSTIGELKPPIKLTYFNFTYDLTNDSSTQNSGFTEVRKVAVYRINKPNITRLEANGISATGKIQKFRSNIGEIKIEPSGGTHKVICNVDQPFKIGEQVSWILNYELVDSFNKSNENVDVPCITIGTIGSIHLIFNPERIPRNIKQVITKKTIDRKTVDLNINKNSPEIFWFFRVKFGSIFSIRWEW